MDEKYFPFIEQFQPLITAAKQAYKEPQKRLQCLFKIMNFIETYNETAEKKISLLALLPLRRSLIPSSISISREVCKVDFDDEEIWNTIDTKVKKLFNIKKGFRFSSLRTDGVSCSLLFTKIDKRTGKRKEIKEEYLEDLKKKEYKELQDKNIVAIDPNKGNLLYCLDKENKNILRFTQNSLRKARKQTKYKKIRKEVLNDTEYKEIKEKLSGCNSRTSRSSVFEEYIKIKNEKSFLRLKQYRRRILRKLRFNSFINTRSLEDRWMNCFKETYGNTSETIVVIGDWKQRKGISYGKEPTKGLALRSLLRKKGYKVYLLDEAYTSKRCCKCHCDNEYNFVTRKDPRKWKNQEQRVWGLSRCTNGECRVVHNRDLNSVTNILNIALNVIQGKGRPEWCLRTFQGSA